MWFALLLSVSPLASADGVKFFEGSWKEALGEAKKTERMVFVDFYTDW